MKHVINISIPTCVFCSPTAYKIHYKTLKQNFKIIVLFGEEKVKNTVSYNSIAFPNNVTNNELFNVKTKELSRDVKYEEFEIPDVDGQIDTAMVLYSSGTTGLPKGVMLTHLNILTACYQQVAYDPTQLTLTITPWYHTMGMIGNLSALFTGRAIVYIPKFEPQLYLNTIEKYKVAQLTVVPPVLVLLTKLQFTQDVSSVRMIYSGAAPLRSDTTQALKTKFPNAMVLQGYGMTEVTLAATRDILSRAHLAKTGGVGIPVGAVRIKVADLETGEALGPYKQGEICVKGAMVMKGYVGVNPDTWRDKEGYLRTGDIGYYDEDCCFFIVDRLKELIKYKGYQVPPAEIEAVLLTHPAVKDAGVVAKEHKEGGEVPVAFLVRQPGASVTEDEVKKFVAERLSNPKHLRGGVVFVEQIPKSASGKILRKDLKQMLKSGKSKL
ncbi:AMP-binding enzyme domain-containing protein [Phthorimaea operculella]|nr:AMP-binding enzyme domain-containing protein [Phthorimaea operculella]